MDRFSNLRFLEGIALLALIFVVLVLLAVRARRRRRDEARPMRFRLTERRHKDEP